MTVLGPKGETHSKEVNLDFTFQMHIPTFQLQLMELWAVLPRCPIPIPVFLVAPSYFPYASQLFL